MGGDLGQRREWSETHALDWYELAHDSHRGLHSYLHDLLHLYQTERALWEVDDSWAGFGWLSANDSENSVIAFVRRAKDPTDCIVVVCNFTPQPRYNYCIPVPRGGFYREILNSDVATYWGSNLGNLGGVPAHAQPLNESGYALCLTLPPLSTLLLKPDPVPNADFGMRNAELATGTAVDVAALLAAPAGEPATVDALLAAPALTEDDPAYPPPSKPQQT